MTREEAIAIIRKEYLCVDRDCDIERSCGRCDLNMPSKEPILQAYKMAIKALEKEPCDDAVSREVVLKIIDKWYENKSDIEDLIILITYMSSVTQKSETVTEFAERCRECGAKYGKLLEQKSGKWIECENGNMITHHRWKCSECLGEHKDPETGKWHEVFDYKYPFCPNCGCRMVEPQESEE